MDRGSGMDSALIDGATVPDFDRDIAAWLQRPRDWPDDGGHVLKIGVRNHDRRIYRHITVRGTHQHFDAIAFFDESGFSALPVDFAKETGLDYVFHHESW